MLMRWWHWVMLSAGLVALAVGGQWLMGVLDDTSGGRSERNREYWEALEEQRRNCRNYEQVRDAAERRGDLADIVAAELMLRAGGCDTEGSR